MTTQTMTVAAPARYVSIHALCYGEADTPGTLVTDQTPLPTVARRRAARSTPLAGTASANTVAGPFVPDLDAPIMVSLSGTWTGRVAVLRSVDGGATKEPLTAAGQPWATFTANACEPVWEPTEAGATFFLQVSITSGTLTYRVSQ